MASPHEPSSKALSFAQLFPHRPNTDLSNLASQFDHRMQLVSFWGITPGSRVLEIGCGQGDCTLVLADVVGENGHVDAVDPGAPDYGAPYTLSQSQAHIHSGPLGERIAFHNADPVTYLQNLGEGKEPYDFIVMSHCIWYFESPSILATIITALALHTKKLCLAEWSLRATKPEALSHVLVALLLASLEAKRKVPAMGNIRTVLSPVQISHVVSSSAPAGQLFKLEKETTEESNGGLLDAYWEVSDTLRKREKVLSKLGKEGVSEKELGAMRAMYDAVAASVGILEGGEKGVRSMDVWAGVWSREQE